MAQSSVCKWNCCWNLSVQNKRDTSGGDQSNQQTGSFYWELGHMATNTSRVFGKSATSNETFGEFPDMFLASEVDIWNKMLESFQSF